MRQCATGPMPQTPDTPQFFINPDGLHGLSLPQLYGLFRGISEVFDSVQMEVAQAEGFADALRQIELAMAGAEMGCDADVAVVAVLCAMPGLISDASVDFLRARVMRQFNMGGVNHVI